MKLPIRLEGTGAATPAAATLSSELDVRIGKPEGWLYRRTGVLSRFYCGEEDQIDLAVAASRQALEAAEVLPGEIDVVLFAAAVPYQTIPATAPLIQQLLGIADGTCAAFDINSTCLSFLTALDMLASLLASGRYRRGLIVASEVASRALPWDDDPLTAALFGDGAAAAVFSAGDGVAHLAAAAMETYPSAFDACRIGSGGTRYDYHNEPAEYARHSLFEMNGEVLYKLTAKHFPAFLDRLLAGAGWERGDVDVVVPHQAAFVVAEHRIGRLRVALVQRLEGFPQVPKERQRIGQRHHIARLGFAEGAYGHIAFLPRFHDLVGIAANVLPIEIVQLHRPHSAVGGDANVAVQNQPLVERPLRQARARSSAQAPRA